MKAPLGIGLVGLFMVLSAYSAAGQAQAPFRDSGSALFETYCSSCHGRDAHGDGPIAESLKTRPPNLTQLARLNGGTFPAEQTRRVIDGREARVRAHGTIEMPVWGDAFIRREGLTDAAARARIDAIVRYLDAIQERIAH
jgi:mono/diheme cytochrome c family protein